MILEKYNSLLRWFGNEPNQRLGIRALQIVLGLVFLFRSLTELPFAGYLYGVNGIGENFKGDTSTNSSFLTSLIDLVELNLFPHLLLLVLASCGFCLILNYKTRIVSLISLIIFNTVLARNAAIGDGGDNVTQIILVYMLFLLPTNKSYESGDLKVWFHNLGVAAIALQIMVLYFTAGFMKINGEPWTSGLAMFNISQVETFSLPFVREIFKNPYITTIASYTTMIFLVWFPIAMFSKLKMLWIFMGISFHLGILGYMGLITFGMTMIGMELFFISDSEYGKMSELAKSLMKNIQTNHFLNTLRKKNPTNLGIVSGKRI